MDRVERDGVSIDVRMVHEARANRKQEQVNLDAIAICQSPETTQTTNQAPTKKGGDDEEAAEGSTVGNKRRRNNRRHQIALEDQPASPQLTKLEIEQEWLSLERESLALRESKLEILRDLVELQHEDNDLRRKDTEERAIQHREIVDLRRHGLETLGLSVTHHP